ncbi:phosphatase PAP2 family protein [Orbaceae bacterium ESL0727]|nr:phosphatase PAP2 family protein [Orbaceae bacterium ESL0727]
MKKTLLATSLSVLFFSASVFAVKDVTTHPDYYFTKEGSEVNSLALLPPPPNADSVSFLRDKALYEQGKLLRSTPRGKLAHDDADSSKEGIAKAVSLGFRFPINEKDTPELYKLITKMRDDAGELGTRSAKETYMRVRPFAFFKEPTCRPEDEKELSTNGSYPSGHTSYGWATALILAEIDPANRDKILQRGYEMGQSRVICGYHWQSDVDAGRVTGAASVSQLHANTDFMAQLQKAKDEFAHLTEKNK